MTLLEKYIIARWVYSLKEEYMSDFEYNRIHQELLTTMPDNEYVKRTWSSDPCPVDLLKKYNLMEYYRDLRIIYYSESCTSIITEIGFKSFYECITEKHRISFKVDGFNIEIDYYNGEIISTNTRGRKGNNLECEVVKLVAPKRIPIKGKVKVIGELCIPNKKWEEYKRITGTKSQRNAVRTAMANMDSDYLEFAAFNIIIEDEYITGDKFEILTKYGFVTPMYKFADNFDTLSKTVDFMGKMAKVYALPTDGLVIDGPKSQFALRIRFWQETVLQSYVTGYDENYGMYGIPIVVKIYPTVVDGRTIREVNITNLASVVENNLKKGYPIAFGIRSEANAVIDSSGTAKLQDEYLDDLESYKAMIEAKAPE